METFELPIQPILVFLVVLCRVGGLVTFAPFWGNRVASTHVRVVLAGVLSIVLTPIASERVPELPATLIGMLPILVGEMLIGFMIGFVGRIIFSAFDMAAHLVAAQMGFSLAATIDPSTKAQTTAFGTVTQMLALMVLLSGDGHHWFLAAAVKSFSATAPGSFAFNAATLDLIIRLSANALTVGVTIAAPAVIVLLGFEFALDIFGKMAPQFQVYILGFPLKIGVGFAVIGASLMMIPANFRSVISNLYSALSQIILQFSQ